MARTGTVTKILNALGIAINPATEEKQDDVIDELEDVNINLDAIEENQTDGSQKTKVVDVNGVNATGEVQATPTANTILGRLKNIWDRLTNGSQTTSIVDPNNPTRKGEFDNVFSIPIVQQVEHHQVHEGHHYFFKSYIVDAGGIGSTTTFAFTTPNTTTRIHAKAVLTPDSDFTVEMREDAVITGGTPVEGFNNDRDSLNVAELDAVAEPTITTPGNLIWPARNGGGKNAIGVSPGFNYEIVAKTNSTYTFEITKNIAQVGIVDIDFFWYEKVPE